MRITIIIISFIFLCGCEEQSDDNITVQIQSNFNEQIEIKYKVEYVTKLFFSDTIIDTNYKVEKEIMNAFHEKERTMAPYKPVNVKYNEITVEYDIDGDKVLVNEADFVSGSG